MRYNKKDFTVIPNKDKRKGLSPNLQTIYMWLCEHSDDNMQSFPGRKTLADECGMSVDTLDRGIKKLIELGMIKKTARKNGLEQTTNLYEVLLLPAESEGVAANSGGVAAKTTLGGRKFHTQNSTHLTQPIKPKGTNVPLAEAEKPPPYGSSDINYLLMYWHQTLGYAITSKKQANRYALSNLLKRYKVAEVERLVQGAAVAAGDQYAPRISDFVDLQSKLNQLLAWGKRHESKKGTVHSV